MREDLWFVGNTVDEAISALVEGRGIKRVAND
jgi:hypothetical protein